MLAATPLSSAIPAMSASPMTAGAKRLPVKQACLACRSAKVRCIGESPCQRCKKRGFDCVFDESKRRRRSLSGNAKRKHIHHHHHHIHIVGNDGISNDDVRKPVLREFKGQKKDSSFDAFANQDASQDEQNLNLNLKLQKEQAKLASLGQVRKRLESENIPWESVDQLLPIERVSLSRNFESPISSPRPAVLVNAPFQDHQSALAVAPPLVDPDFDDFYDNVFSKREELGSLGQHTVPLLPHGVEMIEPENKRAREVDDEDMEDLLCPKVQNFENQSAPQDGIKLVRSVEDTVGSMLPLLAEQLVDAESRKRIYGVVQRLQSFPLELRRLDYNVLSAVTQEYLNTFLAEHAERNRLLSLCDAKAEPPMFVLGLNSQLLYMNAQMGQALQVNPNEAVVVQNNDANHLLFSMDAASGLSMLENHVARVVCSFSTGTVTQRARFIRARDKQPFDANVSIRMIPLWSNVPGLWMGMPILVVGVLE